MSERTPEHTAVASTSSGATPLRLPSSASVPAADASSSAEPRVKGAPSGSTIGLEDAKDAEVKDAAPLLSKKAQNRQHHALAQHGNYHNYYFHRQPVIPDARLQLLDASELFEGKRVLDLGCNAGKLTMEVVSHLGATASHGLDLDAVLISRATSLASTSSPLPIPNCTFACADFMTSPSTFFSAPSLPGQPFAAPERFDTILLFSITKWLHLHHGDQGLQELFGALHKYLVVAGGYLVVEPQEWENYKKATDKNKSLKPMFYTLEMRPPFEKELREEGFELVKAIEREEGGFSRPLLVWKAR